MVGTVLNLVLVMKRGDHSKKNLVANIGPRTVVSLLEEVYRKWLTAFCYVGLIISLNLVN